MKDNRVLLGEVWCLTPDCSQKMNVYKNKKNFFYGRCPSCGCQQQTGEKIQAYFSENVPVGTLNAADDDINPQKMAEAIEEVEETKPVTSKPASEPASEKGSKSGLFLLGGAVLAGISLISLGKV